MLIEKILIAVFGLLLVVNITSQIATEKLQTKILGAKTERERELKTLKDQENYWQKITSDSPTYRDAYVQLALINKELGNQEETKRWLRKTLELDPNFQLPAPLADLPQ